MELFGEPAWPELGESFGDFHVRDELGRGAVARVYLSRQSDVGDRAVVVKASPFPSAEAAVLGRLDHPNIIPIYRVSAGGMLFWYAMKFLEGQSLEQVLKDKGRLPLNLTLKILRCSITATG
jgi:serine/threonine protein kinase